MSCLKVLILLVSFAFATLAGAQPKVTRAPFFSEPRMFERVGIEVEAAVRKYPEAAGISRERVSELLMAKGYQVVDLSMVTPDMRTGLAIMTINLNQIEVQRERNERRQGGGWLGEMNRKYGASEFFNLKGNISVSVLAADTGSRLWMASDSRQVPIADAQSWDQGVLEILQGIVAHYPGVDDKGLSVDDKVLAKKVCGGFLTKTAQCKVGGSDVRLIRQISTEACVKDLTWEYVNGVIATKDGCRAEFAVIE